MQNLINEAVKIANQIGDLQRNLNSIYDQIEQALEIKVASKVYYKNSYETLAGEAESLVACEVTCIYIKYDSFSNVIKIDFQLAKLTKEGIASKHTFKYTASLEDLTIIPEAELPKVKAVAESELEYYNFQQRAIDTSFVRYWNDIEPDLKGFTSVNQAYSYAKELANKNNTEIRLTKGNHRKTSGTYTSPSIYLGPDKIA